MRRSSDPRRGSLSTISRVATGFTLIEVLIAVVVLAIAMGAIIAGMARYADNAGFLNERTLAIFVAHNRLAEIELTPILPEIGKSDGDAEMGGQKWHWNAEVSGTADPNLRRVDIHVQAPSRGGDAATLSSFISSFGRQAQ